MRHVFAFLVLLCLSVGPALPQDVDVMVTTQSKHYVTYDYGTLNETNPGVFISFWSGDWGMRQGVVYNSFRNVSVMVGATRRWDVHEFVSLSVSLGLATGYKKSRRVPVPGTIPFASHSVKIGTEKRRVVLTHFPGGVILAFEIRDIASGL